MILPFSTDEWDFERLTHRKSMADRRRQEKNGRKYIEWMTDVFKTNAPRPLEQGGEVPLPRHENPSSQQRVPARPCRPMDVV